jgi:hypothetical protein
MEDSRTPTRRVTAPIAIGELIDKISILEIKVARFTDSAKRRNVEAELRLLKEIKSAAGLDTSDMMPFADQLKKLNTELWDLENEIRAREARHDFGEQFVTLARNVYLTNDQRARVKHQINLRYGSDIVEEKSYSGR